MLILIDKRIPIEAKNKLSKFGEIIEFETHGIVYETISGHPDIFFCQSTDYLFVAPNTPKYYLDLLNERKVKFKIGKQPLGKIYPQTSSFNAVITDKYLIHNLKNTDKIIIEENRDKRHIHVNQAYTRCNLIAITENHFITSDKGIYNELLSEDKISVLFINPEQIILPGFKNGFFGGCCGILNNNLFITGCLSNFENADEIKKLLIEANVNLIELSDNQLFDGGSILFLESN